MGDTRGERTKRACACPRLAWWEKPSKAAFRSGAPAQNRGAAAPSSGRVERGTRLLRPARRASSPGRESQRGHGDPQGAPAVRCGLHSSSSSSSWPGRCALIPALELPPASNPEERVHTPRSFPPRNTGEPNTNSWHYLRHRAAGKPARRDPQRFSLLEVSECLPSPTREIRGYTRRRGLAGKVKTGPYLPSLMWELG